MSSFWRRLGAKVEVARISDRILPGAISNRNERPQDLRSKVSSSLSEPRYSRQNREEERRAVTRGSGSHAETSCMLAVACANLEDWGWKDQYEADEREELRFDVGYETGCAKVYLPLVTACVAPMRTKNGPKKKA